MVIGGMNAGVKFNDLVDLINKQARIFLHPVFGDIKETSTTKGQAKLHAEAGIYKKAVTKRVSRLMLSRMTKRLKMMTNFQF